MHNSCSITHVIRQEIAGADEDFVSREYLDDYESLTSDEPPKMILQTSFGKNRNKLLNFETLMLPAQTATAISALPVLCMF